LDIPTWPPIPREKIFINIGEREHDLYPNVHWFMGNGDISNDPDFQVMIDLNAIYHFKKIIADPTEPDWRKQQSREELKRYKWEHRKCI
jgi:hypothetical protein